MGRQLEQGVVNADRNPAVIRHRLEAEVAAALEGEPDLGLDVGRIQTELLEARALVVDSDVRGDLPLGSGGLKGGREIRPVGQEERSDVDQHVTVQFPVGAGENKLSIRLKNDFGLSLSPVLPSLGSASAGLRVLSESWTPSRDSLTLEVAGAQGKQYEIGIWNPAQVASVEGAELVRSNANSGLMNVRIPANGSETYPREKIVIHFVSKQK